MAHELNTSDSVYNASAITQTLSANALTTGKIDF